MVSQRTERCPRCSNGKPGWRLGVYPELCDTCEGYSWVVPVGANPPQIDFYDAFDPEKATEKDKELLGSLAGEVLYVDPYTGPATLDRLASCRRADQVLFLTKKVQDSDGTLVVRLDAFREWFPTVRMRRLPGRELHSRYVIARNRLIQLGHSGQGAGRSESLIVDTGDADRLQKQIDNLRKEFKEKWARAEKL